MIDSRFEKATLTAILVHIRRTLRTSNPIQVVGFSFMEFFNSCAVILKTDTRTIFEVSPSSLVTLLGTFLMLCHELEPTVEL